MLKDFIPVEAYVDGKLTVWYMDVSGLNLADLIALKKELKGRKIESISSIDAIIHNNINWNIGYLKAERRENKKVYRNQKALIKQRRQGRR